MLTTHDIGRCNMLTTIAKNEIAALAETLRIFSEADFDMPDEIFDLMGDLIADAGSNEDLMTAAIRSFGFNGKNSDAECRWLADSLIGNAINTDLLDRKKD